MAALLLTRSKTLNLSGLLHRSSSPIDAFPSSSSQFLRALHSLASPSLPRPPLDHGRAPPPPDCRSPAAGSAPAAPVLDSVTAPHHNALLGSRKLWAYEQIPPSYSIKLVHTGTQGLPRWFSGIAHGGTMTHLSDQVISQLSNSTEKNLLRRTCNGKEGDCSKVIAFSPLEGSHTKERKSGLGDESSKIKRMELSQKITYALIPALLLVSKSAATTSLLIFSVYWQIYGFFKEIFLDYVHQEVTRKWVLIYFKLLLLILAKDTILDFDLV
ncbi:succinate dehydrogenase subunit 4, mitochondrial [Elaeis guineensis]|uniref:Succinate dehydrogenase subunit 4, mitochondrial n=1 Tax=Elaeis guineensis var. tenera TaxID=51953 RepID=A0A6I9RUA2_ELAGV|nr:succinate dehydrogenase subunit 4, mitochondrial [Elaeis guineensis]